MAGGASYSIGGMQVAGHHLAVGWLAILFGGITYATSGPKKTTANAGPPINASSSDEADFIKRFMEEQEKSDKNNKH